MKKALIILLGLILVACNTSTKEPQVETNKEIETQIHKETIRETKRETTFETDNETETEKDSNENASKDTMQLALYFVKKSGDRFYLEREVHDTEFTENVARRALELLINTKIKDNEAVRPLPKDTKILGITIDDGIATVDFSKEVKDFNTGFQLESVSLQAITNTLTEFNTIEQVKILVEGKKVETLWGHVNLNDQNLKRDLDLVFEPMVWLDNFKDGDLLTNTTSIRGSMSIFENTLNFRLLDANRNVLVKSYVNGKLKGLNRSDFDFTIDFETPQTDTGILELYAISAKDGSEINNTEINVRFR